MIEVGQFNRDQRQQVEYLLQQSQQGHHVLFGNELVRRAFAATTGQPRPAAEAEAYAAEPHIERLMNEPSLERKRAYIEGLDEESLGRVVRTYFNIVENSIFEMSEVKH